MSEAHPQKELDLTTIISSSIHEIKNDFGGVIVQLEKLRLELRDNPDHAKSIDLMVDNSVRISGELMKLLALYKLGRDKLVPKIEQIAVDDFLEDKVYKHESRLAMDNITIDFQCDHTLAGYFDKDLISSVLDTAVYNAMRFTKSQVLLSAETIDDYLRITVSDDGEGYPSTMLNQSNVETATEMEQGNTGLGLFFAEQIANAHHKKELEGYIQLANGNPGHHQTLGGANFNLYLP